MPVYNPALCVSCTSKSSLFLQCQQTSDGQDFFLFHRTTEAIIRSQEVLNDPNLFGALKMDRNLQAEGNVILG